MGTLPAMQRSRRLGSWLCERGRALPWEWPYRGNTRYAHLDDGHVIEAAQRIGDRIEQSMSGSYSLSRNTKYDSGQLLHD